MSQSRTTWRPVVAALATVVVVFMVGRSCRPLRRAPITYSRATTYFTEPLNLDGTVDYAAALDAIRSEGATPETNGVIPFVKALGPKALSGDARGLALERLGLADLPEEGDYLPTRNQHILDWVLANPTEEELKLPMETEESRRADEQWGTMMKRMMAGETVSSSSEEWQDAFSADDGGPTRKRVAGKRANMIVKRVTEAPWSAEEYPFLVEFLKQHERQLALLAEASRRDHWYVPVVSAETPAQLTDRPFVQISALRSVSSVITSRSMLRLGSGDVEGAWEDARTLHRLARLVAQEPHVISLAMAAGLEEAALRVDAAVTASGGLTSTRARETLDELQSMPGLPGVKRTIDFGERIELLDNVMMMVRSCPDLYEPDHMLRRANDFMDRYVATFDGPDLPARKTIVEEFEEERDGLTARYKGALGTVRMALSSSAGRRRMRSTVMVNVLTSLRIVAGNEDRMMEVRMRHRLAEIAFALAAYRAQEGAYPRDLAALSPGYIPQIPADAFGGGTLGYRAEGGGCLVYSLGRDLRDDGGDDDSDIVVRMGLEPPPRKPLPPRRRRGRPRSQRDR